MEKGPYLCGLQEMVAIIKTVVHAMVILIIFTQLELAGKFRELFLCLFSFNVCVCV